MKKPILAVLFDLDGVLVSTDEYHYRAWKHLADKEGIPFDRGVNERLRGISRMECLDILLEASKRAYTDEEKHAMAEEKNAEYIQLIHGLTPADLLPGVASTLSELKKAHIRTAVASSSKNAHLILKLVQLEGAFDAIIDGNDIIHGKPNPEVFLKAARGAGVEPENCLVVEDGGAGIQAAATAGMQSLGISSAQANPLADYHAENLAFVNWRDILA